MRARKITAILLLFVSLLIIGIHPAFPQSYLPTSTTNQVLEHTYFTLSYAEAHEQAEWVAYRLTGDLLEGECFQDTQLQERSAGDSRIGGACRL